MSTDADRIVSDGLPGKVAAGSSDAGWGVTRPRDR